MWVGGRGSRHAQKHVMRSRIRHQSSCIGVMRSSSTVEYSVLVSVAQVRARERAVSHASPCAAPHFTPLHQTNPGTHSLNAALHILGFRSLHQPSCAHVLRASGAEHRHDADADDEEELKLRQALFEHTLSAFDGGTDSAIAPFYRQLDRAFPGDGRHWHRFLNSLARYKIITIHFWAFHSRSSAAGV